MKQNVFLELLCLLHDPVSVGNLISGFSEFSKPSLYIWKFLVRILLKPGLKDFEHNLASRYMLQMEKPWKHFEARHKAQKKTKNKQKKQKKEKGGREKKNRAKREQTHSNHLKSANRDLIGFASLLHFCHRRGLRIFVWAEYCLHLQQTLCVCLS